MPVLMLIARTATPHSGYLAPNEMQHPGSVKIEMPSASYNFSAPSFRRSASHYYKCVQDFNPPDDGEWSPVPYELLCIAIELELKSRHLEKTPGQFNVKKNFRHNLKKLYEQLPTERKTLTPDELAVLREASSLYEEKA